MSTKLKPRVESWLLSLGVIIILQALNVLRRKSLLVSYQQEASEAVSVKIGSVKPMLMAVMGKVTALCALWCVLLHGVILQTMTTIFIPTTLSSKYRDKVMSDHAILFQINSIIVLQIDVREMGQLILKKSFAATKQDKLFNPPGLNTEVPQLLMFNVLRVDNWKNGTHKRHLAKWQKPSERHGQKEVKITSRNLNKTKTECHDSGFLPNNYQIWIYARSLLSCRSKDKLIICMFEEQSPDPLLS